MLIAFICVFCFPTTDSLLVIATQLLHIAWEIILKLIVIEWNESKLKSVAI